MCPASCPLFRNGTPQKVHCRRLTRTGRKAELADGVSLTDAAASERTDLPVPRQAVTSETWLVKGLQKVTSRFASPRKSEFQAASGPAGQTPSSDPVETSS
ncbi:hypothetical protein IscW_ISCW005024 [Ixodes scapularis]|uniref:Uncharacterized protein n=1 Tax=Ixodes scapularis TaxID=6945 RepID=B7PGY7_IXOSC|nr:hypothetical protein IscW_ISCW005024 [Ixodes scapularis]|eukprot:XP_002401608.1 hypothetical protein IscW_ISCW005024 [Ixodes scapularis]